MNNKIIYTKDDIKSVYFGLENHESFVFPKSCFKELLVAEVDEKVFEISAHIVDNGEIETCITANNRISPLQRLNQYPDIVNIDIDLSNGETISGKAHWLHSYSDENNRYQQTEFINYKELKLIISRGLIKLNLSDVLNLPEGTVVLDEDDNEYLVEWDEDYSYLSNTLVSSKILHSEFRVKSQEL